MSLDLTSTCDRLGNILLPSTSRSKSLNVTSCSDEVFRRRLDFENVSGSSNSNEGLPGDHDKLLVRKTSGKPKQGHLQEGCQAAIFHRKSSEEPKQVHIQGGCQALNSVRKTSGEPK